jgi:murein peptide amidase A
VVSIHAPYGVLDFDGPTVPPDRLGRLYLDQVGIYPGSLGNYGGVQKGMPVVTIELPSAFRTPLDAEMRQMWLDLLRWMSERVVPEDRSPRVVPAKGKGKPAPVEKVS